jgi:UDP-glucuronate 4-epimerase
MRAMVTGCAGFIGSHLTESLLRDGVEVLGVDCFNSNYARADKLENLRRARDHDNFEFVPFDLSRGDLGDLVAACDVIFHLAGEPGVRSSWGQTFEPYVRNNVLATQQLLEAARVWPDLRFVYASSSSIYGQAESLPTPENVIPRPFSPYGVTKLSAEQLCSLYHGNHGVQTVSLRYFSVYGPRQRPDMAFHRFCRAAVRGERITVFGDGEQSRDFTYVGDIVAATRAAAEAPGVAGEVFNVGGGSRVTVNHTLALIEDFSGERLDVEYIRREDGDVRDTAADTRHARALLGFEPQTDLRAGLQAELEWSAETAERQLAVAAKAA